MKRIISVFIILSILTVSICGNAITITDGKNKEKETGNAQKFVPTITNALKIKNWLSSGVNRALLAFSLGANAADDAVLGRADILFAVMQNPTYVGKDINDKDTFLAATITEEDFVFIFYSETAKQAYVLTVPNSNGITLGSIQLESGVSNACSEYYQIAEEDMSTAIQYIQSQIN